MAMWSLKRNDRGSSGSRRGWALAVLLAAAILCASAAHAEVYYTTRDLLAAQFKASARVSFVKAHPTDAQRRAIEQRLGQALVKPDYVIYVATTGERVDGYALFDEEKGQHEPISFATFFDPHGSVTRIEVVAYREPFGDGVRAERFRRQFIGKTAGSGFTLSRDIDAIAGATISSRSLCRGVQRASVLVQSLILDAQTSGGLPASNSVAPR